ncbi:MAG TPA: hypothetical protein VGG03_10710 [Thermoanaerobaculia bacterium]|jgi:hypothetical protein
MHDLDRTLRTLESEDAFETDELDPEIFGESEVSGWTGEGPLSEEEELDLASELLTLSSEEELDQFLGKLFKKVGKGFKSVFRPLGKVLKPLAKTLLPIAGKVAGSFFGGPVGGALGGKLGSMASNLFEVDFESMDPEVQDFEVARRFVRLASAAAQQAADAPPSANPVAAARTAVAAAAQTHAPGLLRQGAGRGSAAAGPCACGGHGGKRRSGRWVRRGRTVILVGI